MNKDLKLNAFFTTKLLDVGEGAEKILIEGYASTKDLDRSEDVVLPEAWKKGGLDNYLKNPVVLSQHDRTEPIGIMVQHDVDTKGLKISAEITSSAGKVFNLIKEGVLRTFSVGFRPIEATYNEDTDVFTISDLELHEISVVSIPANADTLFSVKKSLDSEDYAELKKKFNKSLGNDANNTVTSGDISEGDVSMDKKDKAADIAAAEEKRIKDFAEAAAKKAIKEKELADAAKKEAEEVAAKKKADQLKLKEDASTTKELLKELQTKLEEGQESFTKALAEHKEEIKEKQEELKALQTSKMSFEGEGTSESKEAKEFKNHAVIVAKALNVPVTETKFFKNNIEKLGPHFNAGNVAGWEQEFSSNIYEAVRQELIIEPLFRSIPMNSNIMILPVAADSGTGSWIDQNAGANINPPTDAASGAAVINPLTDVTLRSYKTAAKEFLGFEEEEDTAYIAMLPFIQDNLVRTSAKTTDLAILRGAGGAVNVDPISGVSQGAAVNGTTLSIGAGDKLTVAILAASRQALGLYGLKPDEVVHIVSPDAYYNLLDDTNFLTRDKVGTERATILTGEMGSVAGSKVIVSDSFAAAGAGAAAAVTVNIRNWLVGNHRGLTVERERSVIRQSNVLVATRRIGFTPIISGQGAVRVNYAI